MSEPDYNDIVYRLRNPTYWFFQIVGPKSGATVHGESEAPRDAADEIERLRAELVAERKKFETLHAAWMKARNAPTQLVGSVAERDALRELLREARAWIVGGKVDFNDALADRIDAALGGKDGDS